eukprot:TRINITY_DN1291_c0_g1_i2.p1 TRINITY_DN1291_c0_g1~~TRINITY_DN1291_c0_g1_i2.p1  ORF type:complete len:207 (+),score=51.34 TRINITY_DN1291_c0_g1_i2:115-735(+)
MKMATPTAGLFVLFALCLSAVTAQTNNIYVPIVNSADSSFILTLICRGVWNIQNNGSSSVTFIYGFGLETPATGKVTTLPAGGSTILYGGNNHELKVWRNTTTLSNVLWFRERSFATGRRCLHVNSICYGQWEVYNSTPYTLSATFEARDGKNYQFGSLQLAPGKTKVTTNLDLGETKTREQFKLTLPNGKQEVTRASNFQACPVS